MKIQSMLGDYQDCVLERSGNTALLLVPPERVVPLLPWLGEQRSHAFSALSPHYRSELELDGRDPFYWHFLIWNTDENTLIGGQRLLFVGEQGIPFEGLSGDQSYLEHCYPGLASVMGSHGISYAEIGRTFVLPDYQRKQWLGELIRAFVCLPEARGIRHAFGMISFNQFSCSAQCTAEFLAFAQRNLRPGCLDLQFPSPRFPFAVPPTDSPGIAHEIDSLAALEQHLKAIDQTFQLPAVLSPYLKLCSIRYEGVSVARSYNEILQLLFSGSSEQISPAQRRFLKPYALR